MSISGREPYGGGGGELDRNQQQSPTSNSLAFRTVAAAADGSVYKPIMPPSISIPNINNNNDDGNPFHHVALQHHHHHHQQELVALGGGVGVGYGVDGLNNMNNTEPIKRKRGRPRKYSPPPHNNMGIDLTTPPQQSPLLYNNNQNNNSNSNQCGGGGGGDRFQSSSSPTAKKARGRPPGSSSRKNHVGGTGFTPHLITVKPGEDVLLKIMSFSQNGPRGVCILSAYGTISNVTLRQAATSGGTVTYEGCFEILSISGSFLLSENSGQRSRTGGLSVLLSGPDGRVLGGGVAGLLTAASSVQVIVGSFISEESKGSKQWISQPETMSAPGVSVAGSPPSRGTFSESSGGPGSPPNQSTGACNPQGMPNLAWK
ncbi:AT-hook motif nuclear-localized protein 10-like isoform X2 [Mercurialis annua]|uniref:AT-hook motif nuclear-localized protein 10-like isoform X2 n=1 Tax=Mercurialis annua TaxID=3986 RepID=UPI00215E51AD|nr:AT-hook motif nuclear-localized protein 10-like isoform X2 [Mercurialis annua]